MQLRLEFSEHVICGEVCAARFDSFNSLDPALAELILHDVPFNLATHSALDQGTDGLAISQHILELLQLTRDLDGR
jgi:hypothetical protein